MTETGAAATPPRRQWRRSAHSGSTGGQCVEVAADGDGLVRIRDSKDPSGPVLRFTAAEWTVFRRGVSDGEFDLTAAGTLRPAAPPARAAPTSPPASGLASRCPGLRPAARPRHAPGLARRPGWPAASGPPLPR